jgi:DNA-binding LacI/PurR family transcriptional regulator
MMEQRTDGVIICSSSFSAEQGHQLMAYGFPVVVLNNQTADDSFRFSIYHDDVDGSQQITKHLIDLGHRKIAYLGNSRSGRTTLDRLTGFRDAMHDAGITIPDAYIYEAAGGEAQLGYEAMEYFRNLDEMPTAIFCFNDILAMGVLRACSQARLRVPDQISVAGFDNITYSSFTNPTLTTFDQPKYFLGMEAAKLLLNLLHYEVGKFPLTQTIKVLKGSLLVRNSTAAPAV